MVASVVVYGRLNVNVALNRPTFATSDHGSYRASKAVDGNKNTNFFSGSCFHSVLEANPWMAVDLGAALAVAGVLFTNRGNYGIKVYSLCRCRYETWAQQRCQYTQS